MAVPYQRCGRCGQCRVVRRSESPEPIHLSPPKMHTEDRSSDWYALKFVGVVLLLLGFIRCAIAVDDYDIARREGIRARVWVEQGIAPPVRRR